VYKKVLKEEIEKDKTGGTPDLDDTVIYLDKSENVVELTGSMYNNSRLFCNIVFPEFKTPAGEVLNEKAKYAKTGLDVFKRILTQKGLKSTELLLKEIERYSTKFASVARLIELSKGPVFVYSYYIYYGVKAMATIMDLLGYREYKPGSQLHNDGKTYFIWKGGLDQQVVAQAKNIYTTTVDRINEMKDFFYISYAQLNGEVLVAHSYLIDPKMKIVRLFHSANRRLDTSIDSKLIGKANKCLTFEDIIHFKNLGIETMDFGGYANNTTNKSLKGINDFKLAFGGKVVECNDYDSIFYFIIKRGFEILKKKKNK
jgi:hypothetical protein